jgi:hypothetical protein
MVRINASPNAGTGLGQPGSPRRHARRLAVALGSLISCLALLAAVPAEALASKPASIVRIHNANAWLFASDPNDPCESDQGTLTVAQGYDQPIEGSAPHYFAWADFSLQHLSGCEEPVVTRQMYGMVPLDPGTDSGWSALASAWVDTTISVEGGGESRTFRFQLAWAATGAPYTIVDTPEYAYGTAGRYIDATVSGDVVDSAGLLSAASVYQGQLSLVTVRLK